MCFNLENAYYLKIENPTSPDRPDVPRQSISLQYRRPCGEVYYNGWVKESDRSPIEFWMNRGGKVQLKPLRFGRN